MIKSVYITGGTSGLGAALAREYLAEGWQVCVSGRSRERFKESFFGDLSRPIFHQVDVGDAQEMKENISAFSRDAGGLGLMIANAGIAISHKVPWPDFDLARSVIDTNVHGVLNAFFPAMEIMREQEHGHLVAISSVSGLIGLPGVGAYSASKAAILRLCESYGLDLAPYGISVTAIAPGFIDTPLTQKNTHQMPFLMSAEKAAKLILKAIRRKKSFYCFPIRMHILTRVLSILPPNLYRKIIRLKRFNEIERSC